MLVDSQAERAAAQNVTTWDHAATITILPVDFMNANKKLKMMTTTNEQSSPAGSMEDETTPATNESDNNFVTPESNAWETMLRWKKEIVTPGGDSFFDEMVPKFLTSSEVKTVKDIKNKAAKDKWLNQLDDCCVKRGAFLEKLGEVFPTTAKAPAKQTRIVSVDFGIAESKLSHIIDLEALIERVNETFSWFDPPLTYVGPYFPMIQSSGMGKTKLLYELRNHFKGMEDTECYLCLAGDNSSKQDPQVFSHILDFIEVVNKLDTESEKNVKIGVARILEFLDKSFLSKPFPGKKMVLLFDEAQNLVKDHFMVKGFLFKCIRIWLRESGRSFRCVAIFAGTTSSLANFYPDNKLDFNSISREAGRAKLLSRGDKLPPPFYQTTTIGCCLSNKVFIDCDDQLAACVKEEDDARRTEYDQAIAYGRPLFAKMAEKNQLESGLNTVLNRMLISNARNWEYTDSSYLSILGTRVQMGQTSTEIASRLVSQGYANLIGFSPSNVAQICFHTDPVCARLAMAMMDEDFSMEMEDTVVSGKSKRWWVQRAASSFAGGLCRPEKGDLGEIFVALYLLFCADILRKEVDPEYRNFSVPLDCWVSNLIEPPTKFTNETEQSDGTVSSGELMEESESEQGSSSHIDFGPSVSFIQVCRNYLRLYNVYACLSSESLLKNLYESGTAFYAFQNCPDFDIVASIRYFDGEIYQYCPLLISVKARIDYSPGSAKEDCRTMERRLKAAKCHRAMGLVIVIGSSGKSDDGKWKLKTQDVVDLFGKKELEKKKVIARVLRVIRNDAFGITQAMCEATSEAVSDNQEMLEILACHPFVRPHTNDKGGFSVQRSLRKKSDTEREPYQFLDKLAQQFGKMSQKTTEK
jgi:hypothetical protein